MYSFHNLPKNYASVIDNHFYRGQFITFIVKVNVGPKNQSLNSNCQFIYRHVTNEVELK